MRPGNRRRNGSMRPGNVFVLALLVVVVVLAGCAKELPLPDPRPVATNTQACPRPERPELPQLDGDKPMGHRDNLSALLRRDNLTRWYVRSLEACVDCWESNNSTIKGDQ